MKPLVINAEPLEFSAAAEQILSHYCRVSREQYPLNTLVSLYPSAQILWVRLANNINAEILGGLEQLKYIVTPTTGLDHIDLLYCAERGIEVLSLKGEYEFLASIPATAELTWGLLINLMRNIPGALQHAVSAEWNRDAYKGYDLQGKVIGILGFGRIGKLVAKYAIAFNMQVLYYDIQEFTAANYFRRVSTLAELLEQSDIVTIHIPYDTTTHKSFGVNEIAKMKKGAKLLNTSRGGIIDETALVEALQSGHLSGAAVDVIASERGDYSSNLLIQYAKQSKNLLITPHIGGASYDSLARVEEFMAHKLIRILTQKGLLNAHA